jgi:hypothetical protein
MVTLTLSDILHKLGCPKWDDWCSKTGISPWACNMGYGHTTYSMSIGEAKRWGLI